MAATAAREFHLDDGALTHLMSFLDAPSLCKASLTCWNWNQVASDDFLWRRLHSKAHNPMVNRAEIMDRSVSCEASYGPSESERSHGPSSPAPAHSERLSFKEAYALGQNWRTGRAGRVLTQFPGSSWNSAARMHPDCNHAVLASAGMGSVDVVHIKTGERCSQYTGLASQHMELGPGATPRDSLDALYASVAISPSCRQVAFGGFDGVVRLFDVQRGAHLASASVPAMQPAVTALGFCSIQSTQVIASGMADGRVALSPLQAWDVCQGYNECSLHGRSCNLLGCHGLNPASWQSSPPLDINGPWLTCSLGAGVEVRRIKGECGAGAGLAIVAGTSGGHVKVVDGAAGRVRSSLVGSCSCPVKCLSLHRNGEGPRIPEPSQASAAGMPGVAQSQSQSRAQSQPVPHELSRVVYAGFDHSMVGNGHYNAIFVWDVNSSERVALLHPGDAGLRAHRGGRGVCSRRTGCSDMISMIRSVWADGWKVAVSAGKGVTIFETRTWKPLYEMSIPVCEATTAAVASQSVGACQRDSNWGPSQGVPPHPPSGQGQESNLRSPKKLFDFGGSSNFGHEVGEEVFAVGGSPLKGGCGVRRSLDSACSSAGAGWTQFLPSSPEKLRSAEKPRRGLTGGMTAGRAQKLQLEEVSDSPGSLIFYGNTLAVGLKNDRYALVMFEDPPASRVVGQGEGELELHVKRFS